MCPRSDVGDATRLPLESRGKSPEWLALHRLHPRSGGRCLSQLLKSQPLRSADDFLQTGNLHVWRPAEREAGYR
jgi:hypothetical protein